MRLGEDATVKEKKEKKRKKRLEIEKLDRRE